MIAVGAIAFLAFFLQSNTHRPFASAEVQFTDSSAHGLAIVPASCPSDPTTSDTPNGCDGDIPLCPDGSDAPNGVLAECPITMGLLSCDGNPHTITSVGSFKYTVPTGVTSAHVLVVGGGGAGGSYAEGGGGGGGLIETSAYALVPGSTVLVAVGDGGTTAGADHNGRTNNYYDGENSGFGSLIAYGGGGGGEGGTNDPRTGYPGGSGGGGGAVNGSGYAGGASTAGEGNAGGAGHGSPWPPEGGGGGGAGAPGGNGAATPGQGGSGGNGAASTITGSPIYYAGGGGGGSYVTPGTGGAGGTGGGGAGGSSWGNGENGLPHTGGGGGGSNGVGGKGGSGIVVYVCGGSVAGNQPPASMSAICSAGNAIAISWMPPSSGPAPSKYDVHLTSPTFNGPADCPARMTWSATGFNTCDQNNISGTSTALTGTSNVSYTASVNVHGSNAIAQANGGAAFSCPPPPVTNLTASCPAPGTQITLNWTPSPGATWYYVRVDDLADGWAFPPGTCSGTIGAGGNPHDACSGMLTGVPPYTFTGVPGASYNAWVHAGAGSDPNAYSAPVSVAFSCQTAACVPHDSCLDSTHITDNCGTVTPCTGGQQCTVSGGVVSCQCPAGEVLSNGVCVTQCTSNNFCGNDGNLYHQDSSCNITEIKTCDFDCNPSAHDCFAGPRLSITAVPSVVRPSDTTNVSFSAHGVKNCAVTGSNKDFVNNNPFTCASASACAATTTRASSGITSQTIYTLTCTDNENKPGSKQAIVNVVPVFCEQGTSGC